MYKRRGLPEKGELVICTITRVLPHSAFVNLDEYDKKEAMIHDSELSRKWTRNRKTYLKKGRKLVCKVLKSEKEGIQLSVRRVGPNQKRNKQEEWKLEKKAHNILAVLAKQLKMNTEEIYKKAGNKILEKAGLIYPFLVKIAKEGPSELTKLNIDKKLSNDLYKLIENRITIPKVEITADLKLKSELPNGIEVIKKMFKKVKGVAEAEKSKLKVTYCGSPKYISKVTAEDYKVAEKILDSLKEEGEELAKSKKLAMFELNRK